VGGHVLLCDATHVIAVTTLLHTPIKFLQWHPEAAVIAVARYAFFQALNNKLISTIFTTII
jgi:hypothetical protein